ncbi:CpaD family pilus assembly lipoprotein [Pseudomonas putida]
MRLELTLLALGLALLSGCDSTLNGIRAERFANPAQAPIEVRPQALSLGLHATANGQSLTSASLDALNRLLLRQGRLANQTLTLLPHTPAGARIAQRLAQALQTQGLPARQLNQQALSLQSGSDDLMVIAEALVVQAPTCTIHSPDRWAISPYSAIGTLGCANDANIAAMVSNPRDLISPALLDGEDGVHASNAVQRYHENDLPKLIDMNFKNK